ncbi:MAG: flavodoxin family protein [Brevibacterium aurantiacum]|uniref:Flavodoxin n=1 Tax=Brevibacterium aurantiacum TaxID=273384 RepID=A0A2A3YR80_BREAU|nr:MULTISPECIES: NAD(P)H-dependent oxidoreductase [Brevibacterium]MDN5550184.1 NAD(P)H-dependent oxidoreductase [Brevibacterium sp.]AZL12140.1 flavodoxin [Brevibacterium aurantiacum]AZT92512.1 flavodoxin [Brevibacterium aurantiacum]AZT96363.1 flavodoxin [Brevibacterium aurantiacum]MDN5593224.1 NAD(P)H-dependent oxidoreductase [Brevibacterium sp.]
MVSILLVHHSPSQATTEIAEAALSGLRMPELGDVDVIVRPALEATAEDVLAADGFVLGTTANFGYISGALKHFFDTTYDAVREPTAGRPFSYWIHGGYDTTGAETAMKQITTGLGWRLAFDPLIVTGEVTADHLGATTELAATVAAAASA